MYPSGAKLTTCSDKFIARFNHFDYSKEIQVENLKTHKLISHNQVHTEIVLKQICYNDGNISYDVVFHFPVVLQIIYYITCYIIILL